MTGLHPWQQVFLVDFDGFRPGDAETVFRRDNAGRNDQRERLFHGHAEFNQLILRHHDEESRRRCEGKWNKNTDALCISTDSVLYFSIGGPGDESDAVNPFLRILHHNNALKTPRLVHQQTVGNPLDGLVDAPDERNLSNKVLPEGDQTLSEITCRNETTNKDQQNRNDGTQSRDMNLQQMIRMI